MENYNVHDIILQPSLLSLFSSNFRLTLDKFQGLAKLPDFLFDIGKGIPKDTEYTLLVPLFLNIECDVLSVLLRDFYLPIMYFPSHADANNEPALSISGNLVFAERLNVKPISRRTVYVPFLPSTNDKDIGNPFYCCHVSRSLDPVKCYTDLKIVSRSSRSTILSWGKSLQPAISTVMLCLDCVSKPPIDRSPSIGWWDKFRLIMHGRFHFEWKGNVNLYIKGSIDPYKLTEDGPGFVFCWSKNVSLDINPDDDPTKFMITRSKQFIFAIPQFSADIQDNWQYAVDSPESCGAAYLGTDKFQKVVANLVGNVEWKAGLYFEKDITEASQSATPGDTPRTNDFRPHFLVERTNPNLLDDPESHDSYKGFRSNYVHLSIGFANNNTNPDCTFKETYNAFHLSPSVVFYFQKWWGLFNNSLGLPIRSGPLFKFDRQDNRSQKKFGASLFTAKYQIQLQPVFISDFSRHANSSSLQAHNEIQFTGLKMKTNLFQLDLHQRKQKMHYTNEKLKLCKEVWHMKFNKGIIDCDECDARIVNTSFGETSIEDLLVKSLGIDSETASSSSSGDFDNYNVLYPDLTKLSNMQFCRPSNLKGLDSLYCWVDFNDYIELDVQKPSSNQPRVEILPFLRTPRFTYLRQNEKNTIQQTYPFGQEPSHNCFYDDIKAQEETSLEIVETRSKEVETKIKATKDTINKLSAKQGDTEEMANLKKKLAALKHNLKVIKEVLHKLKEFLLYASVEEPHRKRSVGNTLTPSVSLELAATRSDLSSHVSFSEFHDHKDLSAHSKFNNRFIVNNLLLKWNNRLRNHIIKFIEELEDSKSMRYFMGRKVIKYLEEISRENSDDSNSNTTKSRQSTSSATDEEPEKFSSDDYLRNFDGELCKVDPSVAESEYAYLIKLICPQIQLQSQEKRNSVCLILAQDIELKVLQINAKNLENVSDDDKIARLIETRYGLYLKEMQTFAVNSEHVIHDDGTLFYTKSYGNDGLTEAWPPWINFEGFYDSTLLEHLLLSEKTSASLRFDRVNSLFFSNIKEDAKKINWKNKNVLRADAPKFVAKCDSSQFDVVYTIVTNLVVFSDFKNTKKSQKLKELVLAADLENIERINKYVEDIQRQIRALRETKHYLEMRNNELTENGKQELVMVDMWISKFMLKLLYSVRAIQGSASRLSSTTSLVTELVWNVFSDQIIWHLLDEKRKPLVDLALALSSFIRTNHPDGSSTNSVNISIMQGFNLSTKSIYPELLSPYLGDDNTLRKKMAHVSWKDRPPVGGIPIMEYLNLDFQPLQIQIDEESARKIFDFVFPASNTNDKGFGASSGLALKNKVPFNEYLNDSDNSVVSGRSSVDLQALNPKLPSTRHNTFFPQKTPTLHSLRHPSGNSNHNNNRNGNSSNSHQEILSGHPDHFVLMAQRSSKYICFTRANISNTTLCLSYKGRGHTSIADVDGLTVKIPVLTYQDYICSFKDLALAMKKDIIKVLIYHAGEIIGNKLKLHHHNRKTPKIQRDLSPNSLRSSANVIQPIKNYGAFTTIDELVNDNNTDRNTAKNIGDPPKLVVDSSYSFNQINSTNSTSGDAYNEKIAIAGSTNSSSPPSANNNYSDDGSLDGNENINENENGNENDYYNEDYNVESIHA